ncbi:MAG TPA: CocE/NonD family hydrolase, partial [Gemmatimonadales bacterium]|nr:CocE/NonD family hydrolase [Gemmatimonadales bacterium]
DVRGTGGSAGPLPPREYSEIELDDAVEVIAQLAKLPAANGNVGMWGISWGGFNSIQVAMRQPPALKAIIALHATDDLYHDDVRYIDGGLHIDPYTLQIDHENALPRTPGYPLDSAYFRDRFEAYPWVLTYMKQPIDGQFWRRNGLRYRPEALKIPAYFIGGLLDGYRDMPLRALEYLTAPVKVEIGPWNHSWPDDGEPGPNYEWRERAVRWWNHWLRGEDTGLLSEPRLLLFQRGGHLPDRNQRLTPGEWRFEDWPIRGSRREPWYLRPDGALSPEAGAVTGELQLHYRPGSGTAAADWWGETTGDMARDDAASLTFTSPALEHSFAIAGLPRVRLEVRVDAPLANWTARLEDVAPDGRVSLVTGGVINGTQFRSRTAPERLKAGEKYDLDFELHFTTWTFRRGHRIRVAVSNAQFPMIWPTPYPMTSTVLAGTTSHIELPVIPLASAYPTPMLPASTPRATRPDVVHFDVPGSRDRVTYEPVSGTTTVEWSAPAAWTIGRTRFDYTEDETYRTSDLDPSRASFFGRATHRIRPPGRDIRLETIIDIQSDSTAFHVKVRRTISSGGKLLRQKEWSEAIPRDYH